MNDNAGVKPPILGTVVWGEYWCNLLVEWHMPSLLLADIHAFGERPDFVIYTTKESYGFLEELQKMDVYSTINMKFCIIPDEVASEYITTNSAGTLKKICQYNLIDQAWDEQRPFMWTYPDYIFGPGALRAIHVYAQRGYRAMLAAGICAQLEPIQADPALREAIYGFEGDPMEWGALFLDHLHPFQTTKIWSSRTGENGRSLWPCYLYSDDEKGMFLNVLHPNPYYAYPRTKAPFSKGGLEGDFVELAGIRREEITVLDDGSFIMVEIAARDKPIHAPHIDEILRSSRVPTWLAKVDPTYQGGPIPPLTDEFVARWARIATNPYQRFYFSRTIPLAVRSGFSLSDCKDVMASISARATSVVSRL